MYLSSRETEAKSYSRVTGKTTDADAKRKLEDKIKLNIPLKGKFTQEEAEEYKLQAGKIKRLSEAEENKKVKVRSRKKKNQSIRLEMHLESIYNQRYHIKA